MIFEDGDYNNVRINFKLLKSCQSCHEDLSQSLSVIIGVSLMTCPLSLYLLHSAPMSWVTSLKGRALNFDSIYILHVTMRTHVIK